MNILINFKAKFSSFFSESFPKQNELLKFEFDYDSVVIVPFGEPFTHKVKRKPTKKSAQNPSNGSEKTQVSLSCFGEILSHLMIVLFIKCNAQLKS